MINENCVCKNVTCPRHGNCVECRAFHGSNKEYPKTSCQRLKEEQQAKKTEV